MWIDKNGNHSPGWIMVNVSEEGEEPRYLKCVNPTPEQYIVAGYHWEEPPAPPKRYSKLKVIRALGSAWEAKKAMIEQAGLYDQFVAAAWLAEDDPAFAAVLATLTPEEREMLDTECLYE